MRLRELLEPGEVVGEAALAEVTGITADSRGVVPGMLFAALPGTYFDGTRFAGAAVAAGAVALLAAEDAVLDLPENVAVIRAADPRQRLARMAAVFNTPQPKWVVAVTGTNGKTSVASFTEQIWERLGLSAASIGTLGISRADITPKVTLTSPDPVTLHAALKGLAGAGVNHVALEASSHGLAQRRLDGVRIEGGAFTNISRDHLDYHASFEGYLAAKLHLFADLVVRGGLAVLNADGPGAEAVLAAARASALRIVTVGRGGDDIRLIGLEARDDGLDLEIEVGGRRRRLAVPLIGGFQAENALLAAALATADRSIGLDDALDRIGRLVGARGRLERIGETAAGARVYVDYAHTPDAIATALKAVRPHTSGRLVIVLGAGGNRDAGKRPLMGKAACHHADLVFVTDDNPRNEDPAAIRRAILDGAAGAREIGDRRAAIAEAIAQLGEGDVLLVAGKGHETGQIIGDTVVPFSDHETIRDLLGGSVAA